MIEPCSACGSRVVMATVDRPRKLGQAKADATEVRRCTNARCRMNTGTRRLGETP